MKWFRSLFQYRVTEITGVDLISMSMMADGQMSVGGRVKSSRVVWVDKFWFVKLKRRFWFRLR